MEDIRSLDDPLLDMDKTGLVRLAANALLPALGSPVGRLALSYAQRRAEALHSRMRRDLLKADRTMGDMLAFSGEME